MSGSGLQHRKELGRFALFMALLAVARLLFLWLSPLELSPDEAYYWDWSRRLSWGYYSKPPMVAWLMALSTGMLPVSEFSVRLPAAILNVCTAAAIYAAGRLMAGHRAGMASAVAYSATIGAAVAGYIMTIDAPLLFFWACTLAFVAAAVADGVGGDSALRWTAAGFFCGLGLLSKQTMIALSGAMALFFLFTKQGRRRLGTSGPYLFYFFQFMALLPFLWWNYRHGWITFLHTAHHFEHGSRASVLRIDTFFELLGTQAGLVTPVLFMLLMAAAFCLLKGVLGRTGGQEPHPANLPCFHILTLSGLLPLAAVFLLSLTQRINANWPAPFYISLSLVLGLWITGQMSDGRNGACARMRSLFRPAVALALVLTAVLYAVPFVFSTTSLAGASFDPTVRLRGWKQLALQVDGLLSSLPRRNRTFVVTRRRQTASELAFYMTGRPEVFRWNGPERKIKSQYELWPGPVDKTGWDAIVVVAAGKGLDGLEECFRSFTALGGIRIDLGRGRHRDFNVYLGRELLRWAHR